LCSPNSIEEDVMAVSLRLRRLLTGEYASHRFVPHRPDGSAREVADAAGVSPDVFGKVVVLRDGLGAYVMVVVPASARVKVDAVAAATGRAGLRLASERELQEVFPDCDVGAMPPFGALYGLPVLADATFREQPEFFFRGGGHDEVVGMLWTDYESLARPVVGRWCSRARRRGARRQPAAPRPAAAAV
jgi:Ala-tRNA(Pro) deacylase